jgi:threonine dehydrogenase-like Zn-dependent dehydrogenase
MKACIFDGRQVRVDAACPEPVLAAGEVAVRVDLAGICQTDLEIVKGYMGFRGVLGHEFVGTALGGRHEGRRVVGEINCPCGQCDMCRAALGNHCRRRTVLGILGRQGAMADRLVLPEANLHLVPDSVTDRQAVFAEPLAAAFQIRRQVALGPQQKIVILGPGRLGQLVAQAMKAWGLEPLVVGRSEAKLRIVRSLGIAAVTADAAAPSHDADAVVECTGSAAGLTMAMEFVRPRGTIVLKSTIAASHGLNLAPVVVDEVTVVGSRCGPMGEALESLARGDVQVEPLITAEYGLADAPQALEAAARPEAIKVLVRP